MWLSVQRGIAFQLDLYTAHVTCPGSHFLKLFLLQQWEHTVLTKFLFIFVLRCSKSAWLGPFPCRAWCW